MCLLGWIVCCCWVAVLEFLIEVILWQSIVDSGFVPGGWACYWPGECIGFEQKLREGFDPFMGAKDVGGVYWRWDLLNWSVYLSTDTTSPISIHNVPCYLHLHQVRYSGRLGFSWLITWYQTLQSVTTICLPCDYFWGWLIGSCQVGNR